MALEKKTLRSLLVIQGVVCFLIPLWGVAMLVVGLLGRTPTWLMLGLIVLFGGLPFAWNAFRDNGVSGERRELS
jgi:hypothetical protein